VHGPSAPSGGPPRQLSEARRGLYDSAPFVLVSGAYVLAGALVLPSVGRSIPYGVEMYRAPALLTTLYLISVLVVAIAKDVVLARRPPFEAATWRELGRRWFGARRLVGTLVVFSVLPALLDAMLGFRMALTEIRPFSFDVTLMHIDRWLHFDHQPWELLQPMLGHPAITVFMDRVYVFGWFALLWSITIWQAVHGREPIRLQFLLSFAISWIVMGTITAIALSSAGPVYFGRITGLTDPYQPLMAYLAAVDATTPLHALDNQARLWLTYRTWGGITAMPSMHLAITTVATLAAVRTARWLGVIVIPVAMLMLLGSVHLGWHYAVDSYAGILGAVAIWYLCGRFSKWWHNRLPPGSQDARQPLSSR